jgi:hypothetical protein
MGETIPVTSMSVGNALAGLPVSVRIAFSLAARLRRGTL